MQKQKWTVFLIIIIKEYPMIDTNTINISLVAPVLLAHLLEFLRKPWPPALPLHYRSNAYVCIRSDDVLKNKSDQIRKQNYIYDRSFEKMYRYFIFSRCCHVIKWKAHIVA